MSYLKLDIDSSGIAKVTMARPEKNNAFNDEMIAELTEAFKSLANNSDVRIVILQSEGKHFCAGADLAWMQKMADYSYEENLADANGLANMFKELSGLPQATIARVQGATYGGAVGLVSCCDMAVASDKAIFCLSEVKIGLIPATISPYVIDTIGSKAAKRYFLTAEAFSADKAQQLGLVNEVAATEELDACINALCKHLLANSPQAVNKAKQLIKDVSGKAIDDTLIADTSKSIAEIRTTDEGQEGLRAFLEKRKPAWFVATDNS